ncbi:hypothetical protein THAOC_14570, partial [Thalassiosira oceanica]
GDGHEEGGWERRHGHKLRRPGDVREEVRQVRLEPDRGGVENFAPVSANYCLGDLENGS